jgi:hypothetical protein
MVEEVPVGLFEVADAVLIVSSSETPFVRPPDTGGCAYPGSEDGKPHGGGRTKHRKKRSRFAEKSV